MNYNKLENPDRVAELNPYETLLRIGLGRNDILCDIGAGTGVFTVQAARITDNTVFALEINTALLKLIEEKSKLENLPNIKTWKVAENSYEIDNATVDFVLLVTVFHEISDKDTLLAEIRRIIKKTGKVAVIEFHKRETVLGPPVSHRIGSEAVDLFFREHGFRKKTEFDLGDNFYCLVFV